MATKKQGVGIWEHYHTTDRADGFEYWGHIDGHRVHAKLYWAPADWSNPDKGGRCPYVVVLFDGEMNSFGRYENELRTAGYVGDERPRRNWNELCKVAETIDEGKLAEWIDDKLFVHEQLIAHGCTYEFGCYTYPAGFDRSAINAEIQRAYDERRLGNDRKVA